jgi:peptidoglycan-associated lipoprotein
MKAPTMLLAIASSALLVLTACSTKNVGSTAETSEGQMAGGSDRTGKGGDGTTGFGAPGSGTNPFGQPLTGFSKKPGDESVAGSTPPLMMSKADLQAAERQGSESREARRMRDEARGKLADIYFAFDRWMLSEEGKKNLSQSARFLKENPKSKVLIEGHCDERGSREYNLTLGEKRAKEARQYLADLGVSNRVTVTSYGKERPACAEHDESCYEKNRRAHLVIEAD